MNKPQPRWHVMFLLDSFYLGNNDGGSTQRCGCQALDSKPYTCVNDKFILSHMAICITYFVFMGFTFFTTNLRKDSHIV